MPDYKVQYNEDRTVATLVEEQQNTVVTIGKREYEIFRGEDGTPTMIEARDANATNISGYVAQIGLWFEGKALVDYDGTYEFPKAIIPWFIEQGFDMNYLDEGECGKCYKNPCECVPAEAEPFDCAGKPFEIGCRVENGLGLSGIVRGVEGSSVSVWVDRAPTALHGTDYLSGWDAEAIEVVEYPPGSPNWGGMEPKGQPEPIPTIRQIEAIEDALAILKVSENQLVFGSQAVWEKVKHAAKYLDKQIDDLLADEPAPELTPEVAEAILADIAADENDAEFRARVAALPDDHWLVWWPEGHPSNINTTELKRFVEGTVRLTAE